MDESLERPPIAEFYSISYLYLGTVGVVTTILISSIISGILVCTGKYSPKNLPEKVLFKPIDDLIPRTVQPKKDFEKSEDSTKSEETVSSELWDTIKENLSSTVSAWLLRGHTALKSIL